MSLRRLALSATVSRYGLAGAFSRVSSFDAVPPGAILPGLLSASGASTVGLVFALALGITPATASGATVAGLGLSRDLGAAAATAGGASTVDLSTASASALGAVAVTAAGTATAAIEAALSLALAADATGTATASLQTTSEQPLGTIDPTGEATATAALMTSTALDASGATGSGDATADLDPTADLGSAPGTGTGNAAGVITTTATTGAVSAEADGTVTVDITLDVDLATLAATGTATVSIDLAAEAPSTGNATTFAGTTSGLPSGWTNRWKSTNLTYTEGSGYLRAAKTSLGRGFASWDDADDVADIDIVSLVRTSSKTNSKTYNGIVARGGGSSGSETGITLRLFMSGSTATLHLARYTGGAASDLAKPATTWDANAWYYMRLRLSGTTMQGKLWAVGDSEPAGWDIDITSSHVPGAGKFGIFHYNTNALDWGYFAYETDGGAAPVE